MYSRSRHSTALATLFALAALSFAAPASAQEGKLLVSPDGEIMTQVPEYGSVRTIEDIDGRELLVNSYNEVIALRLTPRQYRREFGRQPRVAQRDNGWGNNGWDSNARPRDRFYDQNPDSYPSDMYPDPDYNSGLDQDYPQGQQDSFPDAPRASIERRDLNPMTGTVPNTQANPTEEASLPVITDDKPADTITGKTTDGKLTGAQVTALQVFLDRNGFSPGVIDGRMGSNVEKALAAYDEATGERLTPSDPDLLDRLANGDGLAFTTYEISAADAAGPYVASIPSDYSEKAKLERLSYTSTREMLAEKFHMDEDYLAKLNPDADFTRPGTIIKVVAPGAKKSGKVASIVADKSLKQVRGYDASGRLLVAYPATIGSSDTPSPTGQVRIERIAHNPGYTYNPKLNFKQGENDKVLAIPPGPNGPVGNTWIALSKPTYGIHGTPDPSKIGKTASHGCVRLTNWDANELAGMVEPGVTVMFKE